MSKDLAWDSVLGKPSKIKPKDCELLSTSSSSMSIVTWSGTKSPLSIYDFARLPSAVLFFMFFLNKSPVEI